MAIPASPSSFSPSSFPIQTLSPLLMNLSSLCPCGNFHQLSLYRRECVRVCVCVCVRVNVCAQHRRGPQVCWLSVSPHEALDSPQKPRLSHTCALTGKVCLDKWDCIVNSLWVLNGNWVSQGGMPPAYSLQPFSARHFPLTYSYQLWIWN